MRNFGFVLFVFSFSTSAHSGCLDDMAKFAEQICGEISKNGSSSIVNASGGLNAEAEGLLKKFLGGAGVEGRFEVAKQSYENVLREDLGSELQNNRNCRIKMVDVGQKYCVGYLSKPDCVVELLSPRNGGVLPQYPVAGDKYETRWDFFWRDCPDANQYHLYVIGPNAINPIVDDDNIRAASYQLRHTSYGIPDSALKGWSWMVRAKVDGNWGEWSEKSKFDVILRRDENRFSGYNNTTSQSCELYDVDPNSTCSDFYRQRRGKSVEYLTRCGIDQVDQYKKALNIISRSEWHAFLLPCKTR